MDTRQQLPFEVQARDVPASTSSRRSGAPRTSLAAPVQRERAQLLGHRMPSSGPAIQCNKKKSLRQRIADKLALANKTGTQAKIAPREQRFVPKLARSRRAGFTPELLRNQKAKLKRVESLPVHGKLDNITVDRRGHEGVGEYMDLYRDARASMHTLMSKPVGRQMMTELDARTAENAKTIGDNAKVMIRSRKPSDKSNMNSPHVPSDLQQLNRGYRFDGNPGSGWGSEVRIDPNEATANRFIGLGHEMVHAHRLAHGKAVGVPQLRAPNDPLFTDPISVGADVDPNKNAELGKHIQEVVGHANHLQEEFETVGLSPTPGGFSPTENALREEHGLNRRNDYSGAEPGDLDDTVGKLDELFDKRKFYQKWSFKKLHKPAPTPVRDMLRRFHD